MTLREATDSGKRIKRTGAIAITFFLHRGDLK